MFLLAIFCWYHFMFPHLFAPVNCFSLWRFPTHLWSMLGESIRVNTSVQPSQREPAPEWWAGGGRVLQGAHADLPQDRGHWVSWPGGTSHCGSLQCPAYIRCRRTVYYCLIHAIGILLMYCIWLCIIFSIFGRYQLQLNQVHCLMSSTFL